MCVCMCVHVCAYERERVCVYVCVRVCVLVRARACVCRMSASTRSPSDMVMTKETSFFQR